MFQIRAYQRPGNFVGKDYTQFAWKLSSHFSFFPGIESPQLSRDSRKFLDGKFSLHESEKREIT